MVRNLGRRPTVSSRYRRNIAASSVTANQTFFGTDWRVWLAVAVLVLALGTDLLLF